MKLIRRKSLALKILRGVALAGLAVVAASSPHFGINLLKGISRRNSKKEWRKFYYSLRYLNRRGYVQIMGETEVGLTVKITRQGESMLKRVDFDDIKLPTSGQWDGKWRVIIFDVPNKKSKNRLAFTEKLKTLRFIMVQKSVWTYPFECYEAIMILRKFYEIERYVTYLEAVEIEDELNWRGRFNLRT